MPCISTQLIADPLGVCCRCLVTLYFVGADKEQLQMKIMNAGAIPTIVRLCASTHGDVQAEAADVLKVLSRNPAAGQVIVDAGESWRWHILSRHAGSACHAIFRR